MLSALQPLEIDPVEFYPVNFIPNRTRDRWGDQFEDQFGDDLSNSAHMGRFAGLNVQQMAAAGYFQAIAYWLNEPLVSQNVYAQVLADETPGRLKILVEFERAPQPDRLIRFISRRLYRLDSDVIEGIHLIARPLGSARTDWECSIHIPNATQRRQSSPAPAISKPISTAQISTAQISTAQISTAPQPLLHESPPSQIARQIVRSQFKFFRAALISGTAIAAFLFGTFSELLLSERISIATVPTISDEAAPWYSENAETAFNPATTGAEVAGTEVVLPTSRFSGRTVEAALETVAVVPHRDLAVPNDPTITLLFGGELSLKDFTFEEASDLDQLFAKASIYQKADVAMIGLAEPLANASTSLQEDFYQRKRPQAVQTLKAGGIDIVNLASEGSMTYGARGLDETLKNLDRQGIFRVGAGRNQQEAHRPEILEVKGQRIAYLGYNPDALKGATAQKAGVALGSEIDQENIIKDIRAIRAQVDWIVVNYRWENALTEPDEAGSATTEAGSSAANPADQPIAVRAPEDWQKSLAHEAIDAGADLVVGYHPKYIQGAEIYRDRAIAYSLGDFIFQGVPFTDHDTAALKVSLRNRQMKVEFLPVTIRNSTLEMATGDRGTAILQAIRNASASFDHPLRFPAILKAQPSPIPTPPPAPPAPPAAVTPATSTPANGIQSEPFSTPQSADFQSPDFQPSDLQSSDLQPSDLESSNLPPLAIQTPEDQPLSPQPLAPQPPAPQPLAPQPLSPQPLSSQSILDQPSESYSPAPPQTYAPTDPASESFSPPAPHPILQESEALFVPAEPSPDSKSPNALTGAETPETWQDSLNLDQWGEKPTDAEPSFTPIPETPIHRPVGTN